MVNRTQTHKKVELSNETFARLYAFKTKLHLAKMEAGDYKNLDYNDAILLAIKIAETNLNYEVN